MMPLVPLAEAFEFIRNGMSVKQSKDAGGLPITRIETISDGRIDFDRMGYADLREEDAGKFILAPGDILLSHINSVEHIGKCALFEGSDKPVIHGMNLLAMRPKPNLVLPRFAMWAMKHPDFKNRILRFVNKAVNQASISTTNLKTVEIPLPPMEQQNRIAGVLDQAAELCRLRTHALDKLSTLGQAIFHEMFGDVAQNPMGFRRGTIGELAAETQYGTSEKASETGPLPVLRMNNLTYDGRMDLAALKYMDLKASDFAKHTVIAGDMLFNRTNSPDLVGKTAVYRGQSPMAFAGYLVRLRANAEGNTEYISAVLNSAYGKATLRGMCKSIIGMANINAKELCKISLPIPPRQLQDAFSSRLAEVDKERPKFEAAITESNTLFASLQHRAFRGEL